MPKSEFKLSERKQLLLLKSVESYIATGVPISSQELTRLKDLKLSSASIRNELAGLEELGYLTKLHTSGGRVPTSKGYQMFVANLLANLPKDNHRLAEIRKSFNKRTKSITELIKDTAKAISDETNYPAVIMLNGLKNFVVESIKITPLLSKQALVLIETGAGLIDPIIITLKDTDEKAIEEASRCLSANFKGRTLNELVTDAKLVGKEIKKDLDNFKDIFENVAHMLKLYIENTSGATYSAGERKVLSLPEMKDSSNAERMYEYIENKKPFETNEDEIAVENVKLKMPEENEFASITTTYKLNGQEAFEIAVVGPKRMDYLKIASALSFISKEFETLNGNNEK